MNQKGDVKLFFLCTNTQAYMHVQRYPSSFNHWLILKFKSQKVKRLGALLWSSNLLWLDYLLLIYCHLALSGIRCMICTSPTQRANALRQQIPEFFKTRKHKKMWKHQRLGHELVQVCEEWDWSKVLHLSLYSVQLNPEIQRWQEMDMSGAALCKMLLE